MDLELPGCSTIPASTGEAMKNANSPRREVEVAARSVCVARSVLGSWSVFPQQPQLGEEIWELEEDSFA